MADEEGERPGHFAENRIADDEDSQIRLTNRARAIARAENALSVEDGAASHITPSQHQLNEYREKLARDLERREMSAKGLLLGQADKARVSPILEEGLSNSPLLTSSLTTTSTESGNTVRGGITPAAFASTPSYPFPRMLTGGYSASYLHRPFTMLSPTAGGQGSPSFPMGAFTMQDKVLSGNSTPASNFTFHPSGHEPAPGGFDFPDPNLYELSLMLTAEPGLDAWWTTVVQIMRDVYKAERVTLAVPADTTDIENVPWGQKATYNEHQEDDLSLGYMARGSSAVQSTGADMMVSSPASQDVQKSTQKSTPQRPGLLSRHSFTSYENNKAKGQDNASPASKRPAQLSRSRSYLPTQSSVGEPAQTQAQPRLNKTALDQHDAHAEVQDVPSWEAPFINSMRCQGRVLPVLQALDYEADPLIDHAGIMRVIDRGRAVALTRSYPYLEANPPPADASPESQKQPSRPSNESLRKVKKRPEPATRLSSLFISSTSSREGIKDKYHPNDKVKYSTSLLDDMPRAASPKYEEYEQQPPSPWSQSPAPSPAVRADPKENPFFTDAMVDEDSFNPDSAPADYSAMRPPEAIGVDNSWTVLHIPLTHVLLSKPTSTFKLDSAVLEQKAHHSKAKDESKSANKEHDADHPSPEHPKSSKPAPIAILSILSPVIPYPTNLRHSLEHLAPHLATSFSLCRHYSNIETELAGLQRRRPATAGFGAVAPDGRALESASYLLAGDLSRQQSLPGSMTSPSDYSAVSKSATGSPGTPGWEQGSFGYIFEKRQAGASPAAMQQGGESYFSSKQRSSSSRQEIWGPGSSKPRSSKDSSPSDKRHSRLSSAKGSDDFLEIQDKSGRAPEDSSSRQVSAKDVPDIPPQPTDESAGSKPVDLQKEAPKHEPAPSRHNHTLLHSYGADFSSTFQSLPPSSSLLSRTSGVQAPSRSGSLTSVVDMPPPSDRLKGLMLDSLPAQVFVALPQTGEIVWVNSRFLSYRGQTVADLAADPWGSIHPDERDDYLKNWSHSLRTGEPLSRNVRIRRFDGAYRYHYARAVASKDKRGVIMQFIGSYMDIHDQHIAELKAARREEIEVSEAKHRLLANLIPQIIFTATEDDGITFANEQWLSYTGQSFEDSLGLGFMDYVHPEDLERCRIPPEIQPSTPVRGHKNDTQTTSVTTPMGAPQQPGLLSSKEKLLRSPRATLSRSNSTIGGEAADLAAADLTTLAKKGVIKVATDANGRISYTTEVRLRSKTGEYRWHLIRCVEIDTIDFGSGASSYFGSATDINDHKILETKLKEAMDSKGRFLSNMSHEIRTPLIGISGMVSFLQDTTLNEEQRDYTNTIQTSANSLIMIINDILDLSKVDAGMMKLKYEWFHTRSLIEDVNELVSTMAIAKRLELNYLVEADVPAWVKGDKVRIRQVLLNVIGNAIKFTSEGEVFSRCRVYRGENSECSESEIMLEFAIVDTGRGFSKEEAELIFKPFSQIDGSSTRQHGGSGLGLVISRQLVELHGGKMEGTAVLGKGSTFTFTARFALPTEHDHPITPASNGPTALNSRHESSESIPSIKSPTTDRLLQATDENASPAGLTSPEVTSAGSSDPSIHSGQSHLTDQSSVTSVNTGLARFSEAAKASGQDLSQMKLEMPSGRSSPGRTVTPDNQSQPTPEELRPPMYSILIICPQLHSREATTQHIEMTLPKEVPHQITAIATLEEAQKYIGGEDPINFTHIVINLGSAAVIIDLMGHIAKSQKLDKTTILVLTDSVQRQAVLKQAADTGNDHLFSDSAVTFIYKPVKPSRFAVIFDPNKVRDVSIDRNRSTAQQMVESQKANVQELEKRMGNKGYKVLLVEDNPVNQKVLMKFLHKIGVDVEIAADGAECTDLVLSKAHRYYSLILCDLHMPRKDGYQACREIRQWERSNDYSSMPIIALSANVMADVQDKCTAAGFSDYVAKPVDFIDLSRALCKFF
ncbi:hypothetical protein B0I35DRAFT_478429 [Stachybotrys elegans]|uniref:histidine kinase n=1 Tax=Stachybotrys elegans TaxID=80388 RepID=A0A8K0SP02_9HYPO|nr:hypothetical protein B0I35DRAFT_478429 [Stachybotrys elegans]